jgi:hypothetical protein
MDLARVSLKLAPFARLAGRLLQRRRPPAPPQLRQARRRPAAGLAGRRPPPVHARAGPPRPGPCPRHYPLVRDRHPDRHRWTNRSPDGFMAGQAGGCGGRHGTPWWVRHARASGQGAAGADGGRGRPPTLLGRRRGLGLGGQPRRQQPAGPRHRPELTGRGGGWRQPPLLDQQRRRHALGANPDGTNRQAIITTGLAGAGLAVDANHLYFTAVGAGPGRGAIWRANLDGTNQQTIVTGQDAASGVSVGF